MPFYESSEQLKDVFTRFWEKAQEQKDVMNKLAKSKVVVRFDITQPDLQITIDFKNPQPGESPGRLSFESDVKPELVVWSTSETTNKFWQGKLNVTLAMAKGQVKMQGSIAKALGLLSKIKPLFKIYPEVLREKGLDHMVL
ncbi:MAG: SCP2 sterol-binding domain-containing protein [Candidatus Thorarchaeota archaeon]